MSNYGNKQAMGKPWRDKAWSILQEQRAKALKAHQEALQRAARDEAVKRLNDSLGQH